MAEPPRWPAWVWVAGVVGAPAAARLAVEAGWGFRLAGLWPDAVWLVLRAAAEECVFRGAVQPWLAARPGGSRSRFGVTPANALTSLLFCVAHLWGHAPTAAAAVMPVSLLLGASLERSGRLWVPIALHVWFNGCLAVATHWR